MIKKILFYLLFGLLLLNMSSCAVLIGVGIGFVARSLISEYPKETPAELRCKKEEIRKKYKTDADCESGEYLWW